MTRNEMQRPRSGDEEHPENPILQNEHLPPIRYEICIRGQVSRQWFDYIDGLTFEVFEKNQTFIRANLADNSALHGLLNRIGELNLTILSIKKISEPVGPSTSEAGS